MTNETLITEILDYCADHYENGWCDLVIETTSRDEITEIIGKASTLRGAIYKLRKNFDVIAEYRADIMATANW